MFNFLKWNLLQECFCVVSFNTGNIWSNLVLVFPKFTQTGDEQLERMLEGNSKPNQLKKSVEDTKDFLFDLANEHSWNISSVDDKGFQVKAKRRSRDKIIFVFASLSRA